MTQALLLKVWLGNVPQRVFLEVLHEGELDVNGVASIPLFDWNFHGPRQGKQLLLGGVKPSKKTLLLFKHVRASNFAEGNGTHMDAIKHYRWLARLIPDNVAVVVPFVVVIDVDKTRFPVAVHPLAGRMMDELLRLSHQTLALGSCQLESATIGVMATLVQFFDTRCAGRKRVSG